MPEIIAEIANAHQGNADTAIKLAKAAKKCGANSVKFQIYFADDFLSRKHSRYTHFKNQSFSKNQWIKIIKDTKKLKIKIYCDILGIKAFNFIKKLDVDGYKIHTSDVSNLKLIKEVSKERKKIFLSCGGVKLTEINNAIKSIDLKNNKVILLHGFQSYPTNINDTNLWRINKLKQEFKGLVEYGFQDHLAGGDKKNLYVSLIALGFGIKYLEKHITFDRKKKGIDYYSSLEPIEFKRFVKIILENSKSLNGDMDDFPKKEMDYRKQTKKMLILNKDKKKGQLVYEKDVEFKRNETNCKESLDLNYIKGKKLRYDLHKDSTLKKIDFEFSSIIVIVARTQSKRLHKKALIKIGNETLIEHLFKRIKKTNKNKNIIFCTTKNKSDDILEKISKTNKITVFRGSEKNVLKRILDGLKKYEDNIVIRVTGDDILVDPYYMDLAIEYLLKNNLDYVDHKKLPSGTETEIFDKETLNFIYKNGKDLNDTEYLTNYITDNKLYFKIGSAPVEKKHHANLRLTVDNKFDLQNVKNFLLEMRRTNKLYTYNLDDVVNFYSKNKIRNNKLYKIPSNRKFNTKLELNKEIL